MTRSAGPGGCAECGKSVLNREQAHQAARKMTSGGHRMEAYRCPSGNGWHFGHTRRPRRPPRFVAGTRRKGRRRPSP